MKPVILRNLAACCAAISILASAVPGQSAGQPAIDSNFINFGYAQSSSILPHVRWNALTHVGTTFVDINSDGTFYNLTTQFTNRNSALKSGGAAANAGVKVIMVVANIDGSTGFFSSTITNTIMQSSTNRATLVSNVVSAVTGDAYCQGVSFDFEPFSYGTATRDGMVSFFSALRTAFNASSKPTAEISLYTNSTYSSTNYDIPGLEPSMDYFLYSCYDWSTGSTSHAVSDADSYIPLVNGFLNAGIPANKMVLTISAYGRYWQATSSTNYGATGTTATAIGFCDGLFDTTLNTASSGPYAANYQTGDESGWYSYTSTNQRVAVWEDQRAVEYKVRLATSFQDSGGVNNGKRLRGVGWWSLFWMGNFSTSYNPLPIGLPEGSASKTRTYTHIYQLCEEILATRGTTKYVFEKFEQDNPRWASFASTQSSSPDNTNWLSTSTKTLIASPGGVGAPLDSTDAMNLNFGFSGSLAGKIFFRHEVLMDDALTAVPDINAMAAKFDAHTAVNAYIYSAGAYTGLTVRLVIMDKNRQLEASPQFAMNSTGWRTVTWDLTDTTAGNITGLATSEPAFTSGNGSIDTLGGGAKDIGFVGFLVEKAASGSTTGNLYFDELSYEHKNPGGKDYKVNEFRYNNIASEFVEIYGPAGTIPSGTELRFYSGGSSTVSSTVDLSGQVIPASGLLVVGDTGVPNVGYVPSGWSTGARNIPNSSPCAMQIYNTTLANVYDSVVYLAMGGLDSLIRQETNGVTGEGYGWIGEGASGTNSGGTLYSMGRYPDGTDTNWNQQDFSFMPASPGAPNGKSITAPVTYNFTTAPSTAFQTYQAFSVSSPVSAGLPASPSGGNAHRCVDVTGGGTESVFGDAALGKASTTGYTVTGEIYLPAAAAPLQANGIGICGSQGSNFFTSVAATIDDSGYESGYWLIYENAAGVGLNDDLLDHADTFKFVWAHNDRMHSAAVEELASATRASTGATQGAWTTFELAVSPSSPQLVAKINGTTIYSGALPTGGPSSGAFMAGFRENHVGAPVASEGTWIDNLQISGAGVPVNISSLTAE